MLGIAAREQARPLRNSAAHSRQAHLLARLEGRRCRHICRRRLGATTALSLALAPAVAPAAPVLTAALAAKAALSAIAAPAVAAPAAIPAPAAVLSLLGALPVS